MGIPTRSRRPSTPLGAIFVALTFALILLGPGRSAQAQRTFTFTNNCNQTVWVGAFSSNQPQTNSGGWAQAAGTSSSYAIANGWNGRFWGRRNCVFNGNTGSCETGDCGGVLQCNGATGIAGTSVAEFTLNGSDNKDFYDVSLVDGFDFPVAITASATASSPTYPWTGACGTPTCTSDPLPNCPSSSLEQFDAAGKLVECYTPCTVFGGPLYCCTGADGSSALCNPTTWPTPPGNTAAPFKAACPTEYTYAYDDATSTFTCPGANVSNYTITFCPNGIGANDGQGPGTPPVTPTGLAATAGNTDVVLSWNQASLATSYSIYRSTTSGGEGSAAIATGIVTLSYVDTTVTNGVTYYYKIAAVNASSVGISSQSSEVSVVPSTSAPSTTVDPLNDFSRVSSKTANWAIDNTNSQYFLGDGARATRSVDDTESLTWAYPNISNFAATIWTYSTNVSGVSFLVSTNNGASYTSVAVTLGPKYWGGGGWGSYVMTPSAALPAGVTNIEVQFTSGTGADWDPQIGQMQITYSGTVVVTVPSAPTGLTATASNADVTLNWSGSAGATSYNVYRGTTSGGESGTPIASGITTTTYDNNGLTNGTTYYYKVSAVNSAGTSALSTEASGTPVNVSSVTDNLNDWTIVSSKTANWAFDTTNPTYFNGDASRADRTAADTESLTYAYPNIASFSALVYIYTDPISDVSFWYSTNSGASYTQAAINTGSETATTASWGYYTITNSSALPAGVTNLQVQFTGAGNAWDPQLGQITINYGGGTSAPSAPTGLTATASPADVKLSWTASSGATSYNVYSGTTSGGESATAIATGITTTTYDNSGLTNGTTYYYKVSAVNAGGSSGQSNEASATPQVAAPAAPTGLTATASPADVKLSWTASSGATSYNVYSGTTSGGELATAIATGVTTTTYDNSGLTNGTTYYYKVSAVNAGGTSAQSNEASATPQVAAPAAPTGLTATASPADVKLSWTASSGATSYNVYSGTTSGGESATAIVSGVTSTTYDNSGLTNGTTYYFKVAAVNAGGTSAQSNEASATPTASSSVTDFLNDWTVVGSKSANWTLDTTNPTYFNGDTSRATRTAADTEYLVYNELNITSFTALVYVYTGAISNATFWYSTNSGSTYTQAAINTGSETATASGWGYYTITNSGAFPTGVTNLKVQFAGTGNAWDPQLGQITINYGGGATAPAAPTGLTATGNNADVTLSWTASSGATSYNIYRGTAAGGESATAIATGITTTTYDNSGLTNGTTYYYKVAALNSAGTSAQSAEASAKPQAAAPAAPTGLTATAGNAQISLSWTASSGATSYNVYRGTAAGGESATAIVTGVTTTTYTNTGLTNGTVYYYKVSAINAGGTSAMSNEASATPAAPASYNGTWQLTPENNTALRLDVVGNGTANGTLLSVATSNGTTAQSFVFSNTGVVPAGDYNFVKSGGSYCVQPAGTTTGSTVEIWSCAGTSAQSWAVTADTTPAGYFQLASASATGMCLNATGTTSGASVTVATCNSSTGQQWSGL